MQYNIWKWCDYESAGPGTVVDRKHWAPHIATIMNGSPRHWPLTRYVKLQVAHAPGMPGKFFPAAVFKGNRKSAIRACITARAWRTCRDACRDRLPSVTGKTFPAFPAHAHLQFCVSGKRLMSACQSFREQNMIGCHYGFATQHLKGKKTPFISWNCGMAHLAFWSLQY